MAKKQNAAADAPNLNPREKEELYCKAVRQRATQFLRVSGVTSVGVGKKVVDGKTTDELCIQFTVSQKKAEAQLKAESAAILPKSISFNCSDLPGKPSIEIPVDVLQRSFATSAKLLTESTPEAARDIRREKRNPVQPGLSVSHTEGSAGTIGAIVFDKSTGEPLVLSNWHVLHGPTGKIGDVVVQPGPFDDAQVSENGLGRLVRSHLGLAGDCAVASIESRRFNEEILELDCTPRRIALAQLDDRVRKSGRTTGVTYGIVSRVGVVAKIDFGGSTGVQDIGGFEITPDPQNLPDNGEVSQGGDSGSLWMLADGGEEDIAVGLHFAGETDPHPSEEHAVACSIHSVLERLNVTFTDPFSGPEHVPDARTLRGMMRLLADANQRIAALEAKKCQCGGHGEQAARPTTAPQQSAEGLAIPVYGNWCGPGHGGGTPIDEVDGACMVHDQCYGRRGYFDCQCDNELIRNLNSASNSGNLGWKARLAASAISNWFRLQPCRNH